MNPISWPRETKVAGLVICLMGAIFGTVFAWLQTPFHGIPQATQMFLFWLPKIELYWPWSLIGASLAGMAFYVLRLLVSGAR